MADKQFVLTNSFNKFINEMTKQYNVTRDEVLRAATAFGDFRTKIWTYFIVQNYRKKKALPVEKEKDSIINRWFPS